MATITVTAADLFRIFEAGCEQGNDEAVAYDWGSSASSTRIEAFRNEMVWGNPPIIDGESEAREAVWAEIERALKP